MRRLYQVAWTAVTIEAASAAIWGYGRWLRPRLLRWGATPEEVSRALPGDDLIPDALYVTTRAITVQAPAAEVFPWLVQLGQNRGGFYTYDRLENLFGLRIHSADRIHPEWQDLKVGRDYVALDPDEVMKLTVIRVDPPHAFVVRTGAPGEAPQAPGAYFKGEIAATWAFVVEPVDETTSRLIIRWRALWRPGLAARIANAVGLEPVHFIMEEGTLRGVRRRAEQVRSTS